MQANISDSDLGQYAESVQGDMATDLQSNSSKEQRFLKAANKQIKLCGQIMDQPVVGKYFFSFHCHHRNLSAHIIPYSK